MVGIGDRARKARCKDTALMGSCLAVQGGERSAGIKSWENTTNYWMNPG